MIFVITTDGLENASREYSCDRVKEMIEYEKEKYGWEFLFLGANMDAVKEAGTPGHSGGTGGFLCKRPGRRAAEL